MQKESTPSNEPMLGGHQEESPPEQPVVETNYQIPLNNRQDSPSLIINLDQLANSIEVKPPTVVEQRLSSTEAVVANDSYGTAADTSLTATVTRLSTPNGAEIFLIGTAHFSVQSVKDVRAVIKSVQPTSIILELCRERAFMLSLDEESLLEQNRRLTFDKIKSAIAEKGLAQGLIFILFIKMSASLTEKLGMAPGAEFRAGSAEAQKIPGCSVVLGDRSLKTTIARAVASVTLWQKIKLIYQVLLNDVSVTQEEVEKCKDKDILEQLLNELGGKFPGLKRVLLDERNVYLAHSIYRWAQNSETSHGPPRVVAIVGIGHVGGIVENWGKTTDDQIRELNEIPTTTKASRIVRKTIKYCTLAIIVYFGYRVLVPTSIQSAIHDKISNSLTIKN